MNELIFLVLTTKCIWDNIYCCINYISQISEEILGKLENDHITLYFFFFVFMELFVYIHLIKINTSNNNNFNK